MNAPKLEDTKKTMKTLRDNVVAYSPSWTKESVRAWANHQANALKKVSEGARIMSEQDNDTYDEGLKKLGFPVEADADLEEIFSAIQKKIEKIEKSLREVGGEKP